MNQRQEIIERLRALELSGGSHEMLSAICRAVAPGAQFGWTQSDFDFMCSKCGKCVDNGRVLGFNFCPRCGRRIVEVDE